MYLASGIQNFVDSQGRFNRMRLLEVAVDAISTGRFLLGDVIPDILHFRLTSIIKKYLFGASSLFLGSVFQCYGIEKSFLKPYFKWQIAYIVFPLINRWSTKGYSTVNLVHFLAYMLIGVLHVRIDINEGEAQEGGSEISGPIPATHLQANPMIEIFRSKAALVYYSRACEITIAMVLVKIWRSFISTYTV